MKLLDRYLEAVKKYLPEGQRDDIIRELSENLRSQIEEEGAAEEAVLRRYGRPAIAAGRYMGRQHLIGPAVFPMYWLTLKMTVGIGLLVYAILMLVGPSIARLTAIAGDGALLWALQLPRGVTLLYGGVAVAFVLSGAITLAFAVVDLLAARYPFIEDWNPRKLPWVTKRLSARWTAIVELAGGPLMIAMWIAALHYPQTLGYPGTLLRAAPVWYVYQWPVIALLALGMAQAAATLRRPEWMRFRPLWRVTANSAGLAMIVTLIQSGDLVRLAATATPSAYNLRVLALADQAVSMALMIVAIIIAVDVLLELRRWLAPAERRRQAWPIAI